MRFRMSRWFVWSLMLGWIWVLGVVLPVQARTFQIPLEIRVPVPDRLVEGVQEIRQPLLLGVHPQATEAFDPAWDTPALTERALLAGPETPGREPLLEAYTRGRDPRQEGTVPLWIDFQPDRGRVHTWEVVVQVNPALAGRWVTLSWELPASLSRTREQVRLKDLTTGDERDMRTVQSYRFLAGEAGVRVFQISVSVPESRKGSGMFGCGFITPVDPPPPTPPGAVGNVLWMLLVPLIWAWGMRRGTLWRGP